MSRSTPVPEIVISTNLYEDEDTGATECGIIIDARVGEYSNGILILDQPTDLHILRDAVDKFISRNHVPKSFTMASTDNNPDNTAAEAAEQPKPKFLGVIEGFINTQYRPTRGFNPDDRHTFRIMTSQEIILDLADMVDMELNDVADAMIFLGYRTILHDGKVGWLLQRRGD